MMRTYKRKGESICQEGIRGKTKALAPEAERSGEEKEGEEATNRQKGHPVCAHLKFPTMSLHVITLAF